MNAPSPTPRAAAALAPRPTAADNRRGILALTVAMAFFVSNDTLTKLASETLPPGEIMTIRGVFASLLAMGLAAWMGHAGRWRLLLQRRVMVRAIIELLVAVAFLSALGHMALGDLTAVMQASPLITALICALSGLEPMGWRRWLAVIAGFAGVLLVVRPTGESFGWASWTALGASSLVAARDLVTRQIRSEVPTVLVLVATSVVVMAGGLLLIPVETWAAPSPRIATELAFAGLFVAAGHYFSIAGFRNTDVAVVSPFRYSIILWAGLFGFLVFGERPDLTALLGAAVIAASGLYTVHRERVRARVERAASAAVDTELAGHDAK
jgi:drug/metabolite transporter (DMT)-like permease